MLKSLPPRSSSGLRASGALGTLRDKVTIEKNGRAKREVAERRFASGVNRAGLLPAQ
jgi:hypothetical protein